MPMDTEIARSFLDWSNEEVLKWLSALSLSQDYSGQFKDQFITGETLIKLSPGALDDLKITEGADRVKILQHITTMRADLIIESPPRRVRSPVKHRRFSESITRPSYNSSNRRIPSYRQSVTTMERTLSPVKRVHTPIRESSPRLLSSGEGAAASPFYHNSPDSLSLESPTSSRMSSPVKLRSRDASPHAAGLDRHGRDYVNRLQTTATLRCHNMKRLSRSLDGLFLEGEDIFDLAARADRQENCNSRLVEILKEENASLKRELEMYYQRVRKLQKLEQEIEHIREGHRMLESSTARREKLEGALRAKLEKQVRSLRGENVHFKAELHRARKQDPKTDVTNGDSSSPGKSREIRRRDTMIMRLIRQSQESTAAREQLEKDLQSTRIQLKGRVDDREVSKGGEAMSDSHIEILNSETEKRITQVYTESIEKLKSVLSAMQNMSQKREQLEKRLRTQLLMEISRLKGVSGESESNSRRETRSELFVRVATLEADVNKWEQKCLELVAEKHMVLEAAVIPRDSRVGQLERTVSEQTITIQELYQQRANYVTQLSDTNQRLAELETKLSSMKVTINEKDTVIQALQHSFFDPDELSQDEHMLTSSPILHHSPVAAKKYGFHLGSQTDIDGTVSLPGDMNSAKSYPQYPPSPPMKRRGVPNGTYTTSHISRGHVNESLSPVRRYPENRPTGGQRSINERNSASRSLSPVKRSSTERGAPVYMVKDPNPPYASGSPTEYPPPSASHGSFSHYSKLSYPLPVSNSAPNSPNTRSVTRKPRISHPNLHFLQVPNTSSPHSRAGKANTSPRGTRMTPPGLPDRAVKSKTPPPNYKLVSYSSGNGNGGGGQSNRRTMVNRSPSKQRHHSVDDILGSKEYDLTTRGHSLQNGSMELFQSLIGGSVPPQSQEELRGYSKVQLGVGGAREPGLRHGHQHSKSSPSSERRNCHGYN